MGVSKKFVFRDYVACEKGQNIKIWQDARKLSGVKCCCFVGLEAAINWRENKECDITDVRD